MIRKCRPDVMVCPKGLVATGLILIWASLAWSEPVLSTTYIPSEVQAGSPAEYQVEMSWPAALEPYVAYPPEFSAVEGGALEFTRLRGYEAEGRQVTRFYFWFVPEEAGLFRFPEITFPYMPAGKVGPESIPEPTLAAHHRFEDIVVAEVGKVAPGTLAVLAGLTALFCSAGIWLAIRSYGRPAAQETGPDFQQRLHEARRFRLDGNFYEYFRTLTGMAGELGAAREDLRARLERRAQEVGYQGTRPPDDELDGWLNDIEQAIRRWREEKESA